VPSDQGPFSKVVDRLPKVAGTEKTEGPHRRRRTSRKTGNDASRRKSGNDESLRKSGNDESRRSPGNDQPPAASEVNGRLGAFGRPLRSSPFRRLWLSLLLSALGDWAARLALAILVLDRTHSAALSALVVAISFVPWLGPGQILATRLAHFRRKRVMVGADLVRAAVFAVLLVHLPTWALLSLVLAASVATPPFEAARSALTVDVVDTADYGSAIALLDITDQSAIVLGYLVGGTAVLAGGVPAALLVNVGSFLLSAAVLTGIHETTRSRVAESVRAQLGRGLRIVLSEVVIRRSMEMLFIAALPAAAIEATVAAYARLVLHVDANLTGVLAAAVPLGIIVTVPLLPRSGGARRLLRAAALVALVGGLIGGAAFGAGHLAGAIVGYLAAGILSASSTPAQIAFQPRIDGADRPAVFSLAQGLVMGSQAIGAAVGGLAAVAFGPRHAAIGWMGMVVALGLLAYLVPIDPAADLTPVETGSAEVGGVPAGRAGARQTDHADSR
jgi:MFS family permease